MAHRQLADRSRVSAGPLYERLRVVAAAAGKEAPGLSVSHRTAGPITLPSGEICVPADVPESLAPAMLDALLAHELAHSLRRDALWLNAALVMEALLFWQPLNRVGRRRLTFLGEIAADDCAVRWTGQPRALVECLVEFAERHYSGPLGEFATAMARDDAALLERSRRLLERDGSSGQEPALSPAAKWFFLAALVTLALALPQLVQRDEPDNIDVTSAGSLAGANPDLLAAADLPASAPGFSELPEGDHEPGGFYSPDGNSLINFDRGVTVVNGNGNSNVDVGSVTINGGRISIDGGGSSRIVVNGNSISFGGDRSSSMIVNTFGSGSSVFAGSGEWLILSRDRNFALLSKGEIALRPDGKGIESIPPGGFLELTQLEGRVRYGFRLERSDDLIARGWWVNGERQPWDADADAALAELLPVAMRESTLGARARIARLRETGGNAAVLDAIEDLDADSIQSGYASIFLELAGGDLADADFERLLNIVGKGIAGAPQLSSLLRDVAGRVGNSDALARAWLAAAARISSNVHRANALEALALEARLQPDGWIALLEAAETIESSVHHANLLAEIADRVPRDEATNAAFLRSVNAIDSSVHRGRALDAYF
jgi:hypothetical protein